MPKQITVEEFLKVKDALGLSWGTLCMYSNLSEDFF
jgi:hypothetical protein